MDFEPFFAALREAIGVVWPECIPNIIHEAEHEMMIAYVTKTLPFASIICGGWNPRSWGVANYSNQAPLSLCYTARVKGAPVQLRQKAVAMEKLLRVNRVLGTAQIVQASGSIAYGNDVSANTVLEKTNMSQRVVAVRTQVVIGESRIAA